VDPARKRRGASSVCAVHGVVGAFFEQGPVEPFDFAVHLWPADRDALMRTPVSANAC
jgi:hypothetical protein